MTHRRPRLVSIASAGVLALVMGASGLSNASSSRPVWTGKAQPRLAKERAKHPEDRYALAGGCYAISAGKGYVVRSGDSFAATGKKKEAEPFHFQATELGRYLLFGTQEDFVAASEGLVGQAAYGVTESHPGAIAGGVVLEQTDAAADALADSDANDASGRGDSVVAAEKPSELADWEIAGTEDPKGFALTLPATDQALFVTEDGTLDLVDGNAGAPFFFELAEGKCADFPEIELNVSGPVMGGATPYQETRGYVDAHLHGMAYEFLGGRARCGRPWHRYGVAYALVDCPDHKPGGHGAVLEAILSGGNPVQGHNTDGWPSFVGWPKYNSLTHEQMYYKWLERAWRGGLRMYTNLLVDNNQLCKIYPYKRNSCNEMDGVRLQVRRILEFQNYIDAQSGGPGEGWFRIVEDPFEAREVINEGKLAVVLGIEVSVPLDCGEIMEVPTCDLSDVQSGLDEVWGLGVRQMELVNKFDNALSGVAGDGGTTGVVVNGGNKLETGHNWKMETCDPDEQAHDKHQMNLHDDGGMPEPLTGRDSLAGGILSLFGSTGAAPVYPAGPHCNTIALSELGEAMIEGMVQRGMIFDPDHMSARAQTEAVNLLDELGYSGVISSHSWSNDTIYPRILELGGVVTPYAGDSTGFAKDWAKLRAWADPSHYFGIGFGSDVNGFGAQGPPRDPGEDNDVDYPFTGFGGATIDQQTSGTRKYDINTDGVAHYGLYPDWIEDLRMLAGPAIVDDLARGAEAYLQMWERAFGIAPDACRPDVADLTAEDFAALTEGMTPTQVLKTLGQPSSRLSNRFTYCAPGGTATLSFGEEGRLAGWVLP